MEQIRIKRNEDDFYRINIADDGTEIVFDLADIGLAIKADKAFSKVQSVQNNTMMKVKAVENKYAKSPNDKQREKEILKAYDELFKEGRAIMNEFLNCPTAMEKLFGEANYFEMFDDLYEQLLPHFEKMNLSVEKIKERIAKKYGKNDSNVLK